MKRRDDTFLELDYLHLWADYSDDEFYCLCLSRRDIAVLQSAIRYTYWPTRWRYNDTWFRDLLLVDRETYLPIWDEILAYASQLERRLIMDCSQALYDGLLAVANAISGIQVTQTQTQTCGDGTTVNVPINNYIQGVTSNGTTIWGSVPLDHGVPLTEYPEGYDNLQDFLDDKCRKANYLFDAIVGTFRALAALDIALLVQTGAGGALVTAAFFGGILVPEVAIPALIAALVGIVGLGLTLGHLDDVADYFEDNRAAVVCAFFNSETTQQAIDTVSDTIDEVIGALEIATAESLLIRTIGLVIASTDTIDQLFTLSLAINYPTADCSNCEMPSWFQVEDGDVTSWVTSGNEVGDTVDVTFDLVLDPQNHRVGYISANQAEYGDGCGWKVNSASWTGLQPNVVSYTIVGGTGGQPPAGSSINWLVTSGITNFRTVTLVGDAFSSSPSHPTLQVERTS